MVGLRQYVLSVIASALICGIVSGLIREGPAKPLVRLICGLFLTVTAIQPIADIDFSDLLDDSFSYLEGGQYATAMGEKMAQETMAGIIKAEAEAYILDKASDLNAEITAEVFVSEEQIPVSAAISGEVSPYVRKQLETILQTDLGIAKENQQWTG